MGLIFDTDMKGKYSIILILVITFAIYANTLSYSFVWDDFNNIVENQSLGKLSYIPEVFKTQNLLLYRPLPVLSIMLDFIIWHLNPFGYHLSNLGFHLANVLLVYLMAHLLIKDALCSSLAAFLFAIHPVQTEAVTYISGRSDPMVAFFLLLAFIGYIKDGIKSKIWRISSLLFFILALLCKEIALIFPLLLIIYDWHYFKRIRKKMFPFLIAALGYIIFRMAGGGMNMNISYSRLLTLPKLIFSYIGLVFLPVNLHMERNVGNINTVGPFLLFAAGLVALGYLIYKISNGSKVVLFCCGWFLCPLLAVSVFSVNANFAEHWLYLPSIGFFLAASIVLCKMNLSRRAFYRICVIVILSLSFLTMRRNLYWRDDLSLYQNTLRYSPQSARLHYNLGNAYYRRGLLDESIKAYRNSLEINPDYSEALNNLGLIYESKDDLKEAEELFKRALKLAPSYLKPYNNLGVLYAGRGDYHKARSYWLKALERNPHFKDSLYNLRRLELSGLAFAEEGYFDHSLWDEVLQNYVKDGLVDYRRLKEDPNLLNAYLKQLANVDRDQMILWSREEKSAFWINAYNALTIKAVMDAYPINSIRDIGGIWDKMRWEIGGRQVTLNQIEHQILRKDFAEPRIHFALVCASLSCPTLKNEAFKGMDLDRRLDKVTRSFINDKDKVRVDDKGNIVYLSRIFKWYRKDFADVLTFISKYLPEEEKEVITGKGIKIKYLDYDWNLNDKTDEIYEK